MLEFETAFDKGISPEALATAYLKMYFHDQRPVLPINPFQMLSDDGISVAFRAFQKYDGVYIPAENSDDIAIVGINSKRPITRQRFTAAHELCHHLKDANRGFICSPNSTSDIERYAENFAAELLMPAHELRKQIAVYSDCNGMLEFDAVIHIAHYFGVSFRACVYRLAYKFRCIDGDISGVSINKRIIKFKPDEKKAQLGLSDIQLYESLFDSTMESLALSNNANNFARNKFQNEYIYFDSRMEGVDIEQEKAAEIVTDLRLHKKESPYCSSEYENIVFTAGLSNMFLKMFEIASSTELSVFNTISLNRELYSCALFPEAGGQLRDTNTLVLGAKFETIDYSQIFDELEILDKSVAELLENKSQMCPAEFIEKAIQIHYRLTVIHPFKDGNGRTTRAFLNILFLLYNLPPVFFNKAYKDIYKNALKIVDTTGNFNCLYEVFFKVLILSISDLTEF